MKKILGNVKDEITEVENKVKDDLKKLKDVIEKALSKGLKFVATNQKLDDAEKTIIETVIISVAASQKLVLTKTQVEPIADAIVNALNKVDLILAQKIK